MRQGKRRLRALGLGEPRVLTVESLVELLRKLLVGGRGEHARLVEEGDDARVLLLDQVQDVLVVHELDVGPIDGLALVLFLFLLEHVLVEVLLELLVGEVDAKLLKGVRLERLKAVDVEDADEGVALGILTDAFVDLGDEPVEQPGVERLCERVPAARSGGGGVSASIIMTAAASLSAAFD